MSESSSSSFVRPELEADWQEKMGRRLVWLRDLGVMGKVHIDVQPDGLPGFHGMPEEDVMNFLPTVTGPEPNTHMAWEKALERLEAHCASKTTATASDVSAILADAWGSYGVDYDELIRFICIANDDYSYVLCRKEPVMPWLFHCMARMFGVEAPLESDENWWATAREHVELGNDERVFSLTDMAWRQLRKTRRRFERNGLDEEVLIGARNVVDLVDGFIERDKNGPICELMEEAVFEPRRG
ncbi:hypothetical protein B0J15DRAFT_554140 [Fusarium solani]|uniref:Uncharacterized protein n=1 Tax=Fusarium solani TaxID=169388 RepID=A0A9P9GFY0_FUSSL|nr:uncharacterized protein B0J15DRAFT_554140 [Fusarium solani]KAH7237264.1 hypothetical protein B0J15DRAFT_554140 [Fusarium solani]